MPDDSQQEEQKPLPKAEVISSVPPSHIVFCELRGKVWTVQFTAAGGTDVHKIIEGLTVPDLTRLFSVIRLTRNRLFATYRQQKMIASREATPTELMDRTALALRISQEQAAAEAKKNAPVVTRTR